MHDSGERTSQETGAQCDPSHMQAAMELLSPYSLYDLATWLGKGADKYAPRNWEKGILFSVCIGKLERHLQQYIMGKTDEDHLSAVGFWWHALAHFRKMIELGKLPASLDNLPKYEQQEPFKPGENKSYNYNPTTSVRVKICKYHPDIPEGILDVEYCDCCPCGVRPVGSGGNEKYRGFEISKDFNLDDDKLGWYVSPINNDKHKYLHKDCKLHPSTGYKNGYGYAEAPGYFRSKEKAKEYIDCHIAFNLLKEDDDVAR